MTDAMLYMAEGARRLKLERVRKFGGSDDEGACDLQTMAIAQRQGTDVALVFGDGSPESARTVVYWAAAVFGAQEVRLVSDAITQTVPRGAKAPAPEMGQLSAEWKAGRRDGLSECLVVISMRPTGAPTLIAHPYERDGLRLRWGVAREEPEYLSGAVVEYCAAGFAAAAEKDPIFDAVMDRVVGTGSLSIDKAWWHRDRVAARFVSTKKCVAFVQLTDEQATTFVNGEEVNA